MDMTALNRSSIVLAAIVNAFIMMFFEKDIHTLAYIQESQYLWLDFMSNSMVAKKFMFTDGA